MKQEDLEQSLVLIKPDALKNSLTGYVLSQLSEFHTGLRFAGAKIVHVGKMLAEEHYAEHRGKVFYPPLIDFIMGCIHYAEEPWKRRVVALVYQGKDAVLKIRDLVGPTNPHEARVKRPGCIRSLGTVVPLTDANGNVVSQRIENLIHASANTADAEREIKLWFRPADMPPAMHAYQTEICTDHFYFNDGNLLTNYQKGSICLMAPGDLAWTSDLEAIRLLQKGKDAPIPLNTIAAKYLINTQTGE